MTGVAKSLITLDYGLDHMRACVLYSGGKDSSLAAYLLSKLGFDVTLLNATFGINDNWKNAENCARALGFKFEVLRLDREILEEAQKIVTRDGYPRWAFDHVHKAAILQASEIFSVLSDGTRRDDRTPRLTLDDYRALESRDGIEYLPVLWGFGHKTIDRLCNRLFVFEEDDSSKINKGDYEGELQTFLEDKGLNVKAIFPNHVQSRVISWRDEHVKGA